MTTQQAYIDGFVKRASEYGINEAQAMEILEKAAGEQLGPFDADRAATIEAIDSLQKAQAYNKKNHPMHYYLNPFVRGPISNAIHSFERRRQAGGLAGGALTGNEEKRNLLRQQFADTLKGVEIPR